MLLGTLCACGGGETQTASSATTASASETQEESAAAPETPKAEAETPAASAEAPTSDGEEAPESALEDTAAPQLQEVALPLFEETRTYTMWTMLPFFMSGLVSDMATDINNMKLLQEYCNIKLEVTAVSDSAVNEQFNLMVSGGDYTDIISDGVSNYSKGYDAAITDEIIIDLYDLAEEYAPNYMYYLDTDPDLRAALVTDNGYLPTLATIYKESGCENGGILIRGDWLEELGMEVPETYDQFHDYVQATMEKYGAQGICIGNAMDSNKGDDTHYSYGYDLNAGGYNVIDGQVVYSYLNDSYYDYLKMVSDWYADGTIYSDFFNAQMGATDKYFAAGQCAVDTGTAANIATIESYKDPDYSYELLPINAPKVNADDQLHFSWTDTYSRIKQQDSWAISTACQDPEGIMQVVNYLFSEDGQLMYNYGDEGHSFEYDAVGNPQYTELITNNPDGISYKDACYIYASAVASGHLPSVMDVRAGYYYFSDAEWAVFDTFRTCDADGTYNLPNGVALNEEENEAYASISSDVTTYAATEIMKFVMGQAELTPESFQTFQDTIISMGGERMEALYQAAYERFLLK
jgi:putative aldouronate transport system substrate-binding protein